MKTKSLMLFIAMIPIFLIYSCKDSEDASLSVSYDHSDKISATGGSATFSIHSNLKWTIVNSDTWVTKIDSREGQGDALVTVTFAPNENMESRISVFRVVSGDDYEEIVMKQVAGNSPAAAGSIIEVNHTEESATLTVDAIENALTYKWYKDDVLVQISESRTFIATESGKYKVAGVNNTGEGEASPELDVVIEHYKGPLKFDDIPDGVFEASGTPSILSTPGPSTWTGTFSKDYDAQKYTITPWGGSEYPVRLYYKSDSLFVDSNTLLVNENDQYYGYFSAFFIAGTNLYLLEDFSPTYDKKSQTIDFGAEYDGYPVWMAILGYDDKKEFAGVAFSEGYEDCKVIVSSEVNQSALKYKATLSDYIKNKMGKGKISLKDFKYCGKIKLDSSRLTRK